MTYLNKHGLPCPPCLIDLSNGMSEIFLSREQTSYLPPIYSLKIAPTNFGTMFIPFKTRLRFMGETLSKACFTSTSKEQTTNPNSSSLLSHSCCQESHGKYLRRTSSFFSKPWVWVSFQFSFSPSTCLSAKIHLQQNGETSAIPLDEDTLNTNSSVSESDFLQHSPEWTLKEKLCFARELTLSFSVLDFPQHVLVCFFPPIQQVLSSPSFSSILTLLPRTAFQFVLPCLPLSLPYHYPFPSDSNTHQKLHLPNFQLPFFKSPLHLSKQNCCKSTALCSAATFHKSPLLTIVLLST